MLKMFFSVIKMFVDFLKYPVYFVLVFTFIFFLSCCIWFVIGLTKGKRLKKGQHNRVKKPSILKRIFVLAPRQFVDDIFEREPEFFRHQGLVIFEGRQGSGKTVSMIKYAMDMQEEYPLSKCCTNLSYQYENDKLKDWRMLVHYKNGRKGVIVCMDELQNWFSSNDSKNFPPEMLGVITQNRKNRRIILGTSQNFYLLSKAIRSQCTEVRRCTTLLGCITIVRRFEPILNSDGDVVEWKKRGMYFFVHDKKLRDSYDTWKVIENLSKSGFKDTATSDISNTTKLYITKKGLLKK